MTMGLKTLPATSMRLIYAVLSEFPGDECFVNLEYSSDDSDYDMLLKTTRDLYE